MKKYFKMFVASLLTVCMMSITAFSATWVQTSDGRMSYQRDDGSIPTSQWVFINNNYYYFDAQGLTLTNTYTPDGYYVGSDGAVVLSVPRITTADSTPKHSTAFYCGKYVLAGVRYPAVGGNLEIVDDNRYTLEVYGDGTYISEISNGESRLNVLPSNGNTFSHILTPAVWPSNYDYYFVSNDGNYTEFAYFTDDEEWPFILMVRGYNNNDDYKAFVFTRYQ